MNAYTFLFIFLINDQKTSQKKFLVQNDFSLTMRNDFLCQTTGCHYSCLLPQFLFDPVNNSIQSCCIAVKNPALHTFDRVFPNHMSWRINTDSAELGSPRIGYDLQNALREELRIRGFVRTPVVTVVTQVRVDPNDPAFENPSKPIGKFLTQEEADHQAKAYGHIMKEDAGRGYRRVVASPKPVEIVEQDAINSLVDANKIVICCGGGGIPVVLNGHHLKGASAVIDKDYASCLLAKELDADMLIILTAVEKVAVNFGKENEEWLDDITVDDAKKYINEGQFAPGSMLPKVQAAVDFASSKEGRTAMITLLQKAKDGIQGKTGTKIHL